MADDDDDAGDLGPDDLDDLGELGDDEDRDDDSDSDEDDAPGKGKSDDEWKPPTRKEWERDQRRLKRYAAARRAGKSVDEQLQDQLGGKGKSGKDDDDDDASAAEARKWRTAAARGQAATQLAAAGFSGTAAQARKLTRLLDLDDAKPDRDGNFDFEDDVDDLKDEYPELFGGRGGRRNEQRRPPDRGPGANQERRRRVDPSRKTSDALLKEAGFR